MDIIENINTDSILDFVYLYGMKILSAILVLVIGLWLVKYVVRLLISGLEKSNVEQALIIFLRSLFTFILKTLVYITALMMLGVEMTAFIAILGAAGLAIGLALQGSLANFAGGVLILLFKPFRVGDFIESGSESGTVDSIDILHTVLHSTNNQKIVIPNGDLANSAIINYSAKDTRRAVFKISINFDQDISKAREIIMSVLNADERLLKDPAPNVVLNEISNNSLNINVYAWAKTSEYWGFYWDNLEKIKNELDRTGIEMPFTQREVHILQEKTEGNQNS